MTIEEKTIKELSLKYGIDSRVVRTVASFPFKFLKHVMADHNDTRPVRIRYLGAFVQKELYNKTLRADTMVNEMLKDENIEEVFIIMVSVLGFPTFSIDGAKSIITLAKESDDYEKIKYIWDAWKTAK